jgi:hypothetical protein
MGTKAFRKAELLRTTTTSTSTDDSKRNALERTHPNMSPPSAPVGCSTKLDFFAGYLRFAVEVRNAGSESRLCPSLSGAPVPATTPKDLRPGHRREFLGCLEHGGQHEPQPSSMACALRLRIPQFSNVMVWLCVSVLV